MEGDLTWIDRAKLAVPSRPADWLARPGIELRARTVLLLAGPGWGKTQTMRELVGADAPAGRLVLWVTLDEGDAEPATFFTYMVAAARDHIPQFGTALVAMLAAGQTDPHKLWARFFEELAAYGPPAVWLALDGADQPGEGIAPIFQALAAVLARLPASVRVAMAARQRPPGLSTRLLATGALEIVGAERLRFSDEEVSRYVEARGGAVSARIAALAGWPLGLALACVPTAPQWGGEDALAAYVQELYEVEDADARESLRQLALLDIITPALCHAAFGPAGPAKRLAELATRHWIEPWGLAWRMPPALREHLRAFTVACEPRERLKGWHQQAAEHLLATGCEADALHHLAQAEAWEALGALIDRRAPELRYAGRFGEIAQAIALFPPEAAAMDARVVSWRGHWLTSRGRADEAAKAYEDAERLYEAAGDAAGCFRAIVRRLTGAIRQGDREASDRLLCEAEARLAAGAPADVADFHLARAMAADQRGDLLGMRAANEAVLAVPIGTDLEVAMSHALAALNLHTAALHRGELGEAGARLDHARAVSAAHGLHGTGVLATLLRAHLHLLTGDAAGAGALITALPAGWADMLEWQYEAVALTIVGHWRQVSGDARGADEAWRQAMGLFERGGYPEGKKLPLERLMWAAVQRHQLDRLPGLAAEASPWSESIYGLALALPLARGAHLAGDPDRALVLLDAALPAIAALEARLLLAHARLIEAAAAGAAGDAGRAAAARAAAEQLIEAGGYGFLRGQDPALWAELGPSAPPGSAARLTLTAFGPFEVRVDGVLIDHWPRRQAKRVLGALVLYPRGLAVEELAELLGGNESVETVRRNVSALRARLDKGAGAKDGSLVRLVGDRYVLAREAAAADLWAFERACAKAEAARAPDPVAAAAAYEAAVAHYRGDLFDDPAMRGRFEAEREAYRRRALDALAWLAAFHGARGDWTSQGEALTRAVAIAPADEAAALALMAHHRERGRPERLRVLYWDLRRERKLALGLPPTETFEAAFRALEAGEAIPG